MKRLLSWLFWIPVAILIIVIAVANRQTVTFSLDPITPSDPIYSADLPLFALLLLAVLVGLLIGGAASWINQSKWRQAAREGLHEAAHWRHEANRMRKETHPASSAPKEPERTTDTPLIAPPR